MLSEDARCDRAATDRGLPRRCLGPATQVTTRGVPPLSGSRDVKTTGGLSWRLGDERSPSIPE